MRKCGARRLNRHLLPDEKMPAKTQLRISGGVQPEMTLSRARVKTSKITKTASRKTVMEIAFDRKLMIAMMEMMMMLMIMLMAPKSKMIP